MHTHVHAKHPLAQIHRHTRVHIQRTPGDVDPDTRTRKDTNRGSGSGHARPPAREARDVATAARSPRPANLAAAARLPGAVCLSVSRSPRPVAARAVSKTLRSCTEMSRSSRRSLARSLAPSLPRRSAPSPPAPHTPSPPLPRPDSSLGGGGGGDPGQAASEGCVSSERDPLAPRAELPGAGASGPREGNSEGCAPREPTPLSSPRGPDAHLEPQQSSEARSSSGTTKMILYTEPPLSLQVPAPGARPYSTS